MSILFLTHEHGTLAEKCQLSGPADVKILNDPNQGQGDWQSKLGGGSLGGGIQIGDDVRTGQSAQSGGVSLSAGQGCDNSINQRTYDNPWSPSCG